MKEEHTYYGVFYAKQIALFWNNLGRSTLYHHYNCWRGTLCDFFANGVGKVNKRGTTPHSNWLQMSVGEMARQKCKQAYICYEYIVPILLWFCWRLWRVGVGTGGSLCRGPWVARVTPVSPNHVIPITSSWESTSLYTTSGSSLSLEVLLKLISITIL